MVDTLAPPMTAATGRCRLVEHAAQGADLLHHQRAGVGRQEARDGVGGGVRAVRGGEGVADEEVAEAGQRLGEAGSFFSSPGWKRRFSSTAIVPGSSAATAALGRLADAVGAEHDRPAEQLAKPVGDRPQAELRVRAALGPAEVRDEHDLGAALGEVLQPRQKALKPRCVA